mmetsp:Transcript_181375/g.575712  ORF Transcript_181375/g.575712 Transcript_181375/m.575712 type:complete len:145 (-) Transcript_181375:202-636(-)
MRSFLAGEFAIEMAIQGVWIAFVGPVAALVPVGMLASKIANVEGTVMGIIGQDSATYALLSAWRAGGTGVAVARDGVRRGAALDTAAGAARKGADMGKAVIVATPGALQAAASAAPGAAMEAKKQTATGFGKVMMLFGGGGKKS